MRRIPWPVSWFIEVIIALSCSVLPIPHSQAAQVVQLYIQATVWNPTRPERELKGFQRIELQPGESRTLELPLTGAHLGSYSPQGEWLPPKVHFQIALGFDSTAPFSHQLQVES